LLYLGAVLDSAFALMTTGIVTLYIITVLMLVGALCSLHRSAVYMTVLSIAVGVGYPAAGKVVGYYLVSVHQLKICNYVLIFLFPCTPLSFFHLIFRHLYTCIFHSPVALVLVASIYVMTMYSSYIGYSAIFVATAGAIMFVVVGSLFG